MKHRPLKHLGNLRIGDLAAALALSVFFWRALIPAGYMPDPENGFIKLCSSQGLITAAGDKSPGDDNTPDHLGAMCAFAAVPAMAPPAVVDFGIAAPVQWRWVPVARVAVQRARDGPQRTQSARAPPSFA